MNDKAGPLRLGQKPLPKMRSVLRSTDKRSSSARAWSGGGQKGGGAPYLVPESRLGGSRLYTRSTRARRGPTGAGDRDSRGSAEWAGGVGGGQGDVIRDKD